MTEQQLFELHANICQTLANPKRLEIITHLRDSEKTVSELTEAMQISQANLSQHLALMRQKGIVTARREGLNIYYRMSNPKIIKACDLMREVLLENLESGAVLVGTARP
ncbi:MAG: metalloregulator ArsR/SmtB family transcription factor [Chloroflexota bacterium]